MSHINLCKYLFTDEPSALPYVQIFSLVVLLACLIWCCFWWRMRIMNRAQLRDGQQPVLNVNAVSVSRFAFFMLHVPRAHLCVRNVIRTRACVSVRHIAVAF